MKKRLLILGRELVRWRQSPRQLEQLEQTWEVVFASGAAEARRALAEGGAQAMVMDFAALAGAGLELADQFAKLQPAAHRLMLADLHDHAAIRYCFSNACQFLAHPCDIAKLLTALERASQIELWFASATVKALAARMSNIPSPPSVYFEIVQALQSSHVSLEAVGELIARDPALTAKLLHLVNSAAFGLPRQMTDPAAAVMYLGFEHTKSLVLLAHTFSHFQHNPTVQASMKALWDHSLAAGRLAKAIARRASTSTAVVDAAFTAGLLHDIGKLLIAANLPGMYAQIAVAARERGCPWWQAEQAVLGATHAEMGAWLGAIWGLPLALVEAVALHHYPSQFLSRSFCPLTAVHAANALLHELETPSEAAPVPPASTVDMVYLSTLGLEDQLPHWRELAGAIIPQTKAAA